MVLRLLIKKSNVESNVKVKSKAKAKWNVKLPYLKMNHSCLKAKGNVENLV